MMNCSQTIKEETPEFALSAAYLSNFQITSDICGKLGFGSCNYICCNYDNLSVVHYSKFVFIMIHVCNYKKILKCYNNLSVVQNRNYVKSKNIITVALF